MSTEGKTRYPIVGVHGMAGFGDIAGLDYFYRVEEAIAEVGGDFYSPSYGAAGSTEDLGENLIKELEALRLETGSDKFNLIGHSQGGLVSRYVMNMREDLVASVTTIGTPHYGTALADVVKRSPAQAAVIAFGNVLAFLLNSLACLTNQREDAMGIMDSLTTEGTRDFNRRFPAGTRPGPFREPPRVRISPWWQWWNKVYATDYSVNDGSHEYRGIKLFSFGSYYNPTDLLDINLLDAADPVLAAGSIFHGGKQNDGFVARESMSFGKVVQDDLVGNHADQINGMLGWKGVDTADWLAVYSDHAIRLQRAGC